MKKILSIVAVSILGIICFSSCYNNKYDIAASSLNVSYTKEIVPIMTAGPCGCHNTPLRANMCAQFSDNTGGVLKVYDDVILAKMGLMNQWAKGEIPHPGGGTVILSERDKSVIKNWVAQGMLTDSDDGGGTITGPVTYTSHIAKIVTSATCQGPSCHGGQAKLLDYSTLSTATNISHLKDMANSKGASGHPGKAFPMTSTTAATILAWINQGAKQ